ncbi:MAG: pyrroline-5-carboxylate reductase [Burkholderiales bacterium]
MKVTFIGGGNMATALIGGLLKNGWSPEDLAVAEIDAEARRRLQRNSGVKVYADLAPAMADPDCVVLAVKPQNMRDVARALAPLVRGTLVVTIAAGIRIGDLSRWLGGHKCIVRAMPNTPALALAGVTGLYAADGVTADERSRAEQVLAAAGRTLWVDSEERIDGITAVSGSGPAYVFYFIEALQRAATQLGFDHNAARLLAVETFKGAAKLADESAESAATLRARVTSEGGTTERALNELENSEVGDAIVRAVIAAAERSRELGHALGVDDKDS